MHTLLDDVRFALRMFARRRRFATLLVATIALGLSAATSIFSLVDIVLWKPLPYRDADRLFWIARTDDSWRKSPVFASVWDNLHHTLADYQRWSTSQRSFEATSAWATTTSVLATDEGAEQISAGRAMASLTSLLGVQPVLGRWFLPGENVRDGQRLAVLSFETWQSRFGGERDVLRRRLTLNGIPAQVIGVLPRGFRIAGDTSLVEVWTPAGISAGDWQPGNFNFRIYGRIKRNVTLTDATREAARLLASDDPSAGVRLENLQAETIKSVRSPLTILVAAAALLLVIACGNVATLLVGDATSRDVEISTRVSLGASPMRVIRQLLTENLLLAAAGCAIGIGASIGAVRLLRALAPSGIPRIDLAHVDARSVVFALTVALATAVVFSFPPLVAVFRSSPAATMRGGSSRITRQRGSIERSGLFVQSALVVVLLAGAALLVRTHRELMAVDPGFRAESVLSVKLRFLPPVTRYRDNESRRALLNDLAARFAALPGAEAASAAFAVPFQGMSSTSINIGGSSVVSEQEEVSGTYIVASPGFFRTMGIALRAGRVLEPVDDAPGSAVVVSETLARRFWPNASAIGQRIRVDDEWRDVVGVVADVRHRSVDEDLRSTFYLPGAQAKDRVMDAVVLRTRGDPREHIAAVRRIVAQADPALAISRVDRLSDLVDATLVAERFRMMLLAVFSVAAMVLASIGIVGVALNTVTRRTRELAIRMAVGAAPAAAIRLAMSATLRASLGGAVVGVVLALGVTRALRPFLYGVSSGDPLTYVGVIALIGVVAGIATWIPARRSARIDLMRTLS